MRANDLFVVEAGQVGIGGEVRVTNDGSPTTFNGVPDWVYEEEVSCYLHSTLTLRRQEKKCSVLSANLLLLPSIDSTGLLERHNDFLVSGQF